MLSDRSMVFSTLSSFVWAVALPALQVSSLQLAADSLRPSNPKIEDFCNYYEKKILDERLPKDSASLQITELCRANSVEALTDKRKPAYNFRGASSTLCDLENCFIFRGGQPAPLNPLAGEKEAFRERQLGYHVSDLRDRYRIDEIISLRFDPKVMNFEDAFGKDFPTMPLSSGEIIYSFAIEEKLAKEMGIKALFVPSPPETEHFIENYVPRIDTGKDSRPYVCRLPKNLPAKAKHWLEAYEYYFENLNKFESEGVEPILTSRDPKCAEWNARYGEKKVATWLAEVKKAATTGNFVFQSVARYLVAQEKLGRRILFHCSSGTDRVGRTGIYYDLYRNGITEDQVRAYRGPFSDPQIDLVLVNYLLSNRAGSAAEYRFVVPDISNPDTWALTQAFAPDLNPPPPVLIQSKISPKS